MLRYVKCKTAFTLIEVMVAVMIISVVLMALIQMYANNTHLFISLKQQTKTNQYISFLIANDKYGHENKSTSMDELVSEFNLKDNLRRELKKIKIKIISTKPQTQELEDKVLELSKTILKTKNSSSSLFRFKLQ